MSETFSEGEAEKAEEEERLIGPSELNYEGKRASDSKNSAKPNIYRVLYVGTILLFYASSSNSGLNMVSQIFGHLGLDSLGRINLLMIYFFSALGNIFAPILVRKGSFRSVLFFSSFGYFLFLACGAIACVCEGNQKHLFCERASIYVINLSCAAVSGLLISIFWAAENSYVSSLSTRSTKGAYFGLTWAMIQSSQLLGNFSAAFLLDKWSHLTYFSALSCICFCSLLGFLCITERPQTKREKIQETQFLEKYNKKDLRQKLKAYLDTIKDPRLRPLLFFMTSSGIILAFFSGFFYEVIESCLESSQRKETVNKQTSMVYIALGAMELVGGVFVSRLADCHPKPTLCKASNLAFQLALGLALAAVYFRSYTICFFSGALIGFADCTTQAMITTIMGSDFEGAVEHFATFNQFQYIGGFMGIMLSIALAGQPQYVFILMVLSFQVITYYQLDLYGRASSEKGAQDVIGARESEKTSEKANNST